jgi:uncharacterized protein YdhG (YjbR/CyaY superfamily)
MRGKDSDAPVRTIDEYLATVSETDRIALEKLRQTIRSAAPKAEEIISYQIPAFRDDYLLVGFAAFKKHLGFYLMSKSVMKEFKEELKAYETAAGTVRFTADKPLPATLVKKLVKARILENKERKLAKPK